LLQNQVILKFLLEQILTCQIKLVLNWSIKSNCEFLNLSDSGATIP